MIQLFIHASNFSYETKEKAVDLAEEDYLPSLKKENVLVVFTAVEKGDDNEVIEKAVENVLDVYSKIKATSVVIYPYAHLSRNLSDPVTAISILKEIEKKLKEKVEVYRSPFGWYKAFTISCIGHPLSELSRRITKGSELVKTEELDVCNKFGFPYSANASFMKNATVEYLKTIFKPESVILGNTEDIPKGSMAVKFLQPQGRPLPCINEDPRIIIVFNGEAKLDFPKNFHDSKNEVKVWDFYDGKTSVDIGGLIYYILFKARNMPTPILPLWISPIHIRLLPVKENMLQVAIEFANKLKDAGLRVQIDARESLGNRIRRAGTEWIPYMGIIGEREIKTGTLTIRIRGNNDQRTMTLDELISIIKKEDPLLIPQNVPVSS
ncbi:threonyl-tRNA synthetase editing domain-containing protein [Acidianus sp. RZ1]|uniref:threonyl-tRNA synthetase editing domain-containing protein n=1 Tax=Acidianus sp. RZ1 TaxID=1540082 RepID=UPI0014912CFC|nr:threonyl-tRNA synthetase editing domain-containing protein [Acidianus sp. RZ1]NON61263.1 Ser-tRNA(Thr) hydrolase [Acidianus sp. RZ1]